VPSSARTAPSRWTDYSPPINYSAFFALWAAAAGGDASGSALQRVAYSTFKQALPALDVPVGAPGLRHLCVRDERANLWHVEGCPPGSC